jgi:hypothetical protein
MKIKALALKDGKEQKNIAGQKDKIFPVFKMKHVSKYCSTTSFVLEKK